MAQKYVPPVHLKQYNKLTTAHSRWSQDRHAKWGVIPRWRLISGKTMTLNCHMTFLIFFFIFCNIMMIIEVITVYWYDLFTLRSLEIFLSARTGYIQCKFF
jgi:hypothetical protein